MRNALAFSIFVVVLGTISAQIPQTFNGVRQIGGQFPGQFGTTQFGTVPGQIPGTIPGQFPGAIGGQIPGQIGTIPGQFNSFGTLGNGLTNQFGMPGTFQNRFGQINQFGRNVPSMVPGGQFGGIGGAIPGQFNQFGSQFGTGFAGQIPGQIPGQMGALNNQWGMGIGMQRPLNQMMG